MLFCIWGFVWGVVLIVFIVDVMLIVFLGYFCFCFQYGVFIDQIFNGVQNYLWIKIDGFDVYFGGGVDQFIVGLGFYQGKDYYVEFVKKGYSVSLNKIFFLFVFNDKKVLGIFCKNNFLVWIDRYIFFENFEINNDFIGVVKFVKDLFGLKEMMFKVVDILYNCGGKEGFFFMLEVVSIDKQMYVLDYDCVLGDFLEMDDIICVIIEKFKKLRILDDILIVVFVDYGYGFGMFFLMNLS